MLPSFLKILFLIVLLATTTIATTTPNEETTTGGGESKKIPYMFDRDASGAHCVQAVQDHSEEDFRLYCINQRQSFQNCAISCSEMLHFEGSTGVCKSHRCSFYDLSFSTHDSLLEMNRLAHGKVTLFAFVPVWEGHAQYIYELLELIRGQYQETTQALLLPIDIHDYTLSHPRFELKPFGENALTQRVHILPEVMPNNIGKHPFLTFVRSLLWREGAKNFDVYTDRPVVFVISHDGTLVKRLVVPTLEELTTAIVNYGGGVSTKVM